MAEEAGRINKPVFDLDSLEAAAEGRLSTKLNSILKQQLPPPLCWAESYEPPLASASALQGGTQSAWLLCLQSDCNV